jgi:hypothetical protein
VGLEEGLLPHGRLDRAAQRAVPAGLQWLAPCRPRDPDDPVSRAWAARLACGAGCADLGKRHQLGLSIFLVLWGMRHSTKLNVFLGVPNLGEEFFPEHLQFLKSFFGHRPMNLLFRLSITVSMVIEMLLVPRAGADDASPFTATAYTFTATMRALAVLEHWFLVIPLPATAPWKWSLRSQEEPAGPKAAMVFQSYPYPEIRLGLLAIPEHQPGLSFIPGGVDEL